MADFEQGQPFQIEGCSIIEVGMAGVASCSSSRKIFRLPCLPMILIVATRCNWQHRFIIGILLIIGNDLK